METSTNTQPPFHTQSYILFFIFNVGIFFIIGFLPNLFFYLSLPPFGLVEIFLISKISNYVEKDIKYIINNLKNISATIRSVTKIRHQIIQGILEYKDQGTLKTIPFKTSSKWNLYEGQKISFYILPEYKKIRFPIYDESKFQQIKTFIQNDLSQKIKTWKQLIWFFYLTFLIWIYFWIQYKYPEVFLKSMQLW